MAAVPGGSSRSSSSCRRTSHREHRPETYISASMSRISSTRAMPDLHDLDLLPELLKRLDVMLRAFASPVVSSDRFCSSHHPHAARLVENLHGTAHANPGDHVVRPCHHLGVDHTLVRAKTVEKWAALPGSARTSIKASTTAHLIRAKGRHQSRPPGDDQIPPGSSWPFSCPRVITPPPLRRRRGIPGMSPRGVPRTRGRWQRHTRGRPRREPPDRRRKPQRSLRPR